MIVVEQYCGGRRRRLRTGRRGALPIEGTPWLPARPAPPARVGVRVALVAVVLVLAAGIVAVAAGWLA